MIITVVQYTGKDAYPKGRGTDVSDQYTDHYEEMRRRGYWLAIEVQRDGAWAVSVENRRREADCEIVQHRSGLRVAIESMLHRRAWRKQAPKVNHHAAI